MKVIFVKLLLLASVALSANPVDSIKTLPANSVDKMMTAESKLTIGGYAQIDYNQPLNRNSYQNGLLDVHRLVMLFGYKFNDRTQFFTELEFEHISEVYVEQAFLDYKINPYIHFRGGLMLIPIGIINEYHEPPTYNGVERPHVDNVIVPTTWRELGAGFTGNIPRAMLKYQLYVVNGFKSYDEDGYYLNGKDAFRKGRQKGAESIISTPNLSGKVDYYGLPGLNLGMSLYTGKTQSKAYQNVEKDSNLKVASADSTVVGLTMLGLDARYQIGGLHLRGVFYYSKIKGSAAYNTISGKDLGSSMVGYYAEAGYNVFHLLRNVKSQLIPFIRYEQYDTHFTVDGGLNRNKAYQNEIITSGLGWKPTPGTAIKADLQFINNGLDQYKTIFNAGIGVMF